MSGSTVESAVQLATGSWPTGSYPAKLDEKGRMKLASDLLGFFASEPDTRIFVTTIMPGIASMYPMRVWQKNLELLGQAGENFKQASALQFWANAHGANTALDNQGRVLIPQVLRTKLELEAEGLVLVPYGQRIDIYRQSHYEAKMLELATSVETAFEFFQAKGLM